MDKARDINRAVVDSDINGHGNGVYGSSPFQKEGANWFRINHAKAVKGVLYGYDLSLGKYRRITHAETR